jgi:hypothetical protein
VIRLARGLAFIALSGAFSLSVYLIVIRPWHLTWGATAAEARQPLPGDDVVAHPVYQYTRAITIDAPAAAVWPWLVQIGQGRGGYYSYDWLENLFGCDIHSADRILPEFQRLAVGDTVRMYREGGGPPPFIVVAIDPGRALVLGGGDSYSWAFVLQPIDAQSTRLIVRARSYSDPPWVAPLAGVEPITFFMEQKMLRGIKQRAEAH